LVASVIGAIVLIWSGVKANYEWDTQYGSLWSLSVKASTIEQKSEYIDKFVDALDKSGLQGTNDALMYYTPDNSFDSNIQALKSLQGRLHDISKMDETSFAYQTAIQQITAQEQDDNNQVIGVVEGSWWKVHHYYLWNDFIILGLIAGLILLGIAGGVMLAEDNY